jgi:hypothetical protein
MVCRDIAAFRPFDASKKRQERNRARFRAELAARGMDTRRLQHFLGHASITNTVRYTAMSPELFKDIWRGLRRDIVQGDKRHPAGISLNVRGVTR